MASGGGEAEEEDEESESESCHWKKEVSFYSKFETSKTLRWLEREYDSW